MDEPRLLGSPAGTLTTLAAGWADLLEGEEVAYAGVEPAREPKFEALPDDLDPRVASALVANGVTALYRHQAEAWEAAQRGDMDITRWLDWFLGCLGRALDGAEQMLAAVLYKARVWRRISAGPINDRQRLVINRLLDGFKGFLSTSKYAKLARCSTDTALRDIRELLDRGILVQNSGGGRSTSYRLADPESVPA